MIQMVKKIDLKEKSSYNDFMGVFMKSYVLTTKFTGTKILYTATASNSHSEVISSLKSYELSAIIKFLAKFGIERSEVIDALTCMSDNDHNKAEFGHFGGFTYSMFEGILQ